MATREWDGEEFIPGIYNSRVFMPSTLFAQHFVLLRAPRSPFKYRAEDDGRCTHNCKGEIDVTVSTRAVVSPRVSFGTNELSEIKKKKTVENYEEKRRKREKKVRGTKSLRIVRRGRKRERKTKRESAGANSRHVSLVMLSTSLLYRRHVTCTNAAGSEFAWKRENSRRMLYV